jgi:hypothetical protein
VNRTPRKDPVATVARAVTYVAGIGTLTTTLLAVFVLTCCNYGLLTWPALLVPLVGFLACVAAYRVALPVSERLP